MSVHDDEPGNATELDVRGMRKPEKHPAIFAAYAALPVGGSFVLVNDHDPVHLRAEFATEHADGFGWEYLSRQPRDWRVRITRRAAEPPPRIVADTAALAAGAGDADASGAVWRLEPRDRDLDSNVIALPPGDGIDAHDGPDVDVLVHVLGGSGTLTAETGDLDLAAGALLWLPRRSRRGFAAGPQGLRYLTVHRRRQALQLAARPPEV